MSVSWLGALHQGAAIEAAFGDARQAQRDQLYAQAQERADKRAEQLAAVENERLRIQQQQLNMQQGTYQTDQNKVQQEAAANNQLANLVAGGGSPSSAPQASGSSQPAGGVPPESSGLNPSSMVASNAPAPLPPPQATDNGSLWRR